MEDKICDIRERVKKQKPLIHCITNPISINQCANIILSVGAKPIMAEHPGEVQEITDTADVLMLNTGNITDVRMESMMLSFKVAKEKSIPVILDAVGVACSKLRREYVFNLLEISMPSLIKGNYSEIVALYDEKYSFRGIDSEGSMKIQYVAQRAKELAKKYGTVILATGEQDIITDGKRVVYVKNGIPELASVTGTGCMLGALCSAFMISESPMDATISACICFGICGELSKTEKGNGSFMVNLLDNISTLKGEEISKYISMEEE